MSKNYIMTERDAEKSNHPEVRNHIGHELAKDNFKNLPGVIRETLGNVTCLTCSTPLPLVAA